MKDGDVLVFENTRFEDVDGKKESKNDPELGKYWASLGDLFVNDAFGTAHRAHASNVGIASNLESAAGFLMEKEIKFIGGFARFMVGGMAGSSAVLMKVTFLNSETGKVVAEPEFYRAANGMGGGYSMGATDNLMLDQIAQDIALYAKMNL